MAGKSDYFLFYIIAAIFIAGGVAMMIAALATDCWVSADSLGITIDAGLFRYCIGSSCTNLEEEDTIQIDDNLRAIQALCILACLFYIFGFFACLFLCFKSISRYTLKVAIACLVLVIIGVIFDIAGAGHFYRREQDKDKFVSFQSTDPLTGVVLNVDFLSDGMDSSVGYSFYLAWTSTFPVLIGAVMATIAAYFLRRDGESKDQNRQTYSARMTPAMHTPSAYMNGAVNYGYQLPSYTTSHLPRGHFLANPSTYGRSQLNAGR